MTHPTTPAPLSAATEEAKACPFCGHCGPLYIGDGSTFRWFIASCDECGATRGETCLQTLFEGTWDEWLAKAKAQAIAEWNQRAPAPVAHHPEGWISVEDRLPEPNVEVLCAGQGRGDPFVTCCYYDDEQEGWWTIRTHWTDAVDSQQYPTHWMALPNPPQGASNEQR